MLRYWQCQQCGKIHQIDDKYKPKGDNIYITLWCDKCKEYVQMLDCGTDVDALYETYNLNVDPKYY